MEKSEGACNQCSSELKTILHTFHNVCVNAPCPNYGLFQVPSQVMDKFQKDLKEKR